MKSLILQAGVARSEKVCRASFLLTPLALVVCSGVQAAVVPSVPGAGMLGNQLRQESVRTLAAPVSAPLVLPEEGQARHALSADNHTTVSVKQVVFTGNPPGLKGLSEADLQRELAADLNHPQTFAGLEAMAQKITALYRHHGLLVVPSWRRICKVILRNDYWCRGLSFSPTRVHNYRNYMARLKRQREEWGLI